MDTFMRARSAMFRTGTRLPATSKPQPEKADTDHVLMRFLTVGGATVELRSHRFTTQCTRQGRPCVSDHAREVDGFVWECLGCEANSERVRWDYGRYLPNERAEARDHANAHAEICRAMPKP
jgi:hypothetical protein